MKHFILLFSLLFANVCDVKAADIYLFYNANSEYLDEIGIDKDEVWKVFDGEFGPAAEELPHEVDFKDFYVAKYPDKKFVFILDAPFNCGQLGCNNVVFERDEEGDLIELDSKDPVKCKIYDADKLLCTKGGYKPEVSRQKPRKKILHFPAPAK